MELAKLKPRVVIVDDDEHVVAFFVKVFSDEFEVIGVTAPEEVLARVDGNVAVAVVDERMTRLSGIEVLSRLQAEKPEITRILLTAYADFNRLAAAINEAGIYRYLAKPWRNEEMRQVLHQAAERHRLIEENRQLLDRLQRERDLLAAQKQFLISRNARGFAALIGESEKLQKVMAQARRVIDARISVFIEGETGTGKELLARAVHYEGVRRDQLFVAINCAAIPDTLLESELFGHTRDAYTGARDKKGLVEIADQGTVFLDEIGAMPLALQSKLLRFLEDGEFMPLGGTRARHVDVRIIAATNRDLQAEVAAGRFGEDLYFRIAGFPLKLPPLRERPEDILALAGHFLSQASAETGKKISTITDDATRALRRYSFPGNVRELKNMIERAVLLADGPELELRLFSDVITAASSASEDLLETEAKLKKNRDKCDSGSILEALKRAGGNRRRAAQELGISYRWLLQLIQTLGLS